MQVMKDIGGVEMPDALVKLTGDQDEAENDSPEKPDVPADPRLAESGDSGDHQA